MRVAVLTTVHSPLDGRIFFKQVTSLVKDGHTVTYFAPYDPLAVDKIKQIGATYRPLPVAADRLSRPKRWYALANLLRQETFDVWHFHDPELLPLTILWRALFAPKVALIYDAHEDLPKDIVDKKWIPQWARRPTALVASWIERWGIARCNLVVAATDSIGEHIKLGAKQWRVVRNYPLDEIANGSTKSKSGLAQGKETSLYNATDPRLQVIYCGNLTEPRGIREIVQAMDHLHDCPVKLTLLGLFYPETFAQEIRQIAGSNVEMIAKVPFEQVPKYLQASHIGIVCFLPGPNYLEAMPNKLFEYMQTGLPVIASDFPLWRKIIEGAGCGLLVDPASPQQIAGAIRTLVSDEALREQMGRASAKAAVEQYSWQSEARTLLNAYQKLAVAKATA